MATLGVIWACAMLLGMVRITIEHITSGNAKKHGWGSNYGKVK